MKIVVLDGYTLNPGDNPWDAVERLGQLTVHDRTPPELIVERAREAEIVLTNKTPLSIATLAHLPRLKFVSVLATGYNIVDIAAARQRGVVVSNVPEYATDSVAQFVFALLLELCHHVARHDAAVKGGQWAKAGLPAEARRLAEAGDFSFWETPQIELAGKRIGIVGHGRIGRRVGEIARAFGMEVLSCGRDREQMRRVFAEADVVSLHCPQSAENVGLVNRELLGLMKREAFFINTARGGLVVEQDLADALNAGRIAGAAVDVVSVEPIRPDNPLLSARNCLITPHLAWASLAARRRLMAATARNIEAYLAGKPMNVVN